MNSMNRTKPCFKHRRLAAVLLMAALLGGLTACGQTKMEQTSIFAMDTVMTLTAYGKHAEAGLKAAASVINSMDAQLDPEVPTSITYAINHADGANVVVSPQIAKMLSTAKTVYDQSEGSLDLSVYPLVKLWGFVDSRYYVPTNEELSAQILRKAFDKMVLTSYPATGSYSVSFPAGTEISFGAVGKGCAAENAIDAMRCGERHHLARRERSDARAQARRQQMDRRHSGPQQHRELGWHCPCRRNRRCHQRQLSALLCL